MKETAAELAPALSLIFQASLQQSTLPDDWKKFLFHQSLRKATEGNQLIIDQYLWPAYVVSWSHHNHLSHETPRSSQHIDRRITRILQATILWKPTHPNSKRPCPGYRREIPDGCHYLWGRSAHLAYIMWTKVAVKHQSSSSFLQRNMRGCPNETRPQCYSTLVRHIMEYASTIWDPSTPKKH